MYALYYYQKHGKKFCNYSYGCGQALIKLNTNNKRLAMEKAEKIIKSLRTYYENEFYNASYDVIFISETNSLTNYKHSL